MYITSTVLEQVLEYLNILKMIWNVQFRITMKFTAMLSWVKILCKDMGSEWVKPG